MAIDTKKMGLYGAAGVLVACLMIAGLVISGAIVPSLRLPGFIPNTGTLTIKITDAPVDLERLDITIDSVSAHKVEGDAWIDLTLVGEASEVSFDLLALEDETMDLCINEVSPGNYTMIKIHVNEAYAVYPSEVTASEDNRVPLNVPSEAVRVIVHFEVKNGEETTVLIDIDPDWVAISKSNNFRPVLKATVIEDEDSG